MTDPFDMRFFGLLQQVLARTEGVSAECRAAVDLAVGSGAPLDLEAARRAIHALPDDQRDRIMAQVHAGLAGDPSAIWDLLPNASGMRRPN